MKNFVLLLSILFFTLCALTTSADEGRVRINVLSESGGAEMEAIGALLRGYAPFADVQFVPVGENAYVKIPLLEEAGVNAQAALMDFPQVASLARKGLLEPLDEHIGGSEPFPRDEIWGQALDAVTVNGKVYGMPVHITVGALVYNKELFAQLGLTPPKTWDDFLATAQKLASERQPDGSRARWGTFFRDKFAAWFAIYSQSGGKIVDAAEKKVLFNNKDAVDALRFLVDLHHKFGVAPLIPPFGRSFTLDQVPMMILIDEDIDRVKGQAAAAAPLPTNGQMATNLQGKALILFKNATPEQKDVAWKLFRIVAGTKVQTFVSQTTGWLTPNRKVSMSAAFRKELERNPVLATYNDAIPAALPFPAAEGFGIEIEEILKRSVMDALWGVVSPEDAIADATRQVQELLQGEAQPQIATRDDLSPFGMGIYFGNRYSPEEMERAGELASDARIRWSREEFFWGLIEPQKGAFQWERYDRAVDAASRYGVKLFGLLCYTVGWSSNVSPRTDAHRADFANYVYEVVARYKDRIKYWEIWNEPNIGVFWTPSPNAADYVALLRESYRAVKRADPTAQVMLGGSSGSDFAWLEAIYQFGGGDYFDVLGFHPYADIASLDDGRYEQNLRFLRLLMTRYGAVKRGWITEVGWPTTEGGNTYEQQAAAYAKMVAHSLGSGFVDKIVPYDFRDDGDDPAYGEANFGVLRRDFNPKTAYFTYGFLAQHVANYTDVIRTDPCADCYGYRFTTPKGYFSVIWSKRKGKSLDVDIPVAGGVEVFDLAGKKTEFKQSEKSVSIRVTNNPIFLIETSEIK
ncbi:MAG: extracellular solute-binding protein [bacterium]